MPILFTAIEIPALIQTSILDLRPTTLDINLAAQLHITLHYIGKVSDIESKAIQTKLQKVKATAYSQQIKGAGVFHRTRSSGVLWAGVNKCDQLLKLHTAVGLCLEDIGLKLEARDYQPHITISRIKNGTQELIESYLDQYRDFNADFTVNSFSLFSSERTQFGAVYTKLDSYNF